MTRNKTTIVTIVTCVLIGILALGMLGVILQLFTPYKPSEWFNKELVATTEEEMNELLTEENIGKSVKYTGETVKKVELPYAVGDEITSVYFDTEFDLGTFLQNLDWENAHVKGLDFENTTADVICLVGTLNFEGKGYDDYIEEGIESPSDDMMKSMLLWVLKVNEYDDGETGPVNIYYIHSREEDSPYFGYIFDLEGELVHSMTTLPEGFNGGPLDNGNSFVIDYINPALMQEDALFLGVENGKYGAVETVFEKDQVYTIEKAEDGTLAYVIAE